MFASRLWEETSNIAKLEKPLFWEDMYILKWNHWIQNYILATDTGLHTHVLYLPSVRHCQVGEPLFWEDISWNKIIETWIQKLILANDTGIHTHFIFALANPLFYSGILIPRFWEDTSWNKIIGTWIQNYILATHTHILYGHLHPCSWGKCIHISYWCANIDSYLLYKANIFFTE